MHNRPPCPLYHEKWETRTIQHLPTYWVKHLRLNPDTVGALLLILEPLSSTTLVDSHEEILTFHVIDLRLANLLSLFKNKYVVKELSL